MDLSTIATALTTAGAAAGVVNETMTAADRLLQIVRKKGDSAIEAEMLQVYRGLVDATRGIAQTEAKLREVEAQLRSVNSFEEQARKFELQTALGGALVWALRDDVQEPTQYLCTRCYEAQTISRLQPLNAVYFSCPVCATRFDMGRQRSSPEVPVKRQGHV